MPTSHCVVLAALNNRIRHLWPVIIIIIAITSLLGGTDDAVPTARVFYDFIFKPQRRARSTRFIFFPPLSRSCRSAHFAYVRI